MSPPLGAVLELLGFPQSPASDLFGESIVGLQLVVVGRSLSAGFDAIGEHLRRRLIVGKDGRLDRRVYTSERHPVTRLGSVALSV